MKKLVFLVVLFLVSINVVMYCYLNSVFFEVGTFSANEYREEIEKFSSNEVLGEVLTKKDAIEKAEKLWSGLYGENVKNEKPYRVFF